MANVTVTFNPVDSGPSSAGRTNSDGKFVLLSQTGRAGAVAGQHKVVLSQPVDMALSGPIDMSNPATREAMMKGRSGQEAQSAQRRGGAPGNGTAKEDLEIPAEYLDPSKTPLEFTVQAGSNEFDIPIP